MSKSHRMGGGRLLGPDHTFHFGVLCQQVVSQPPPWLLPSL